MGSLVVRCYSQKYDRELAGLIVCGSPSNNPGAGPGKALAKLLTLFYGERHRVPLFRRWPSAAITEELNFQKVPTAGSAPIPRRSRTTTETLVRLCFHFKRLYSAFHVGATGLPSPKLAGKQSPNAGALYCRGRRSLYPFTPKIPAGCGPGQIGGICPRQCHPLSANAP